MKLIFKLVIVCCFLSSAKAIAQDAVTSPDKWHVSLVEPYLMFPNMKGTVGLGTLPDAEVDENPGDIFSNLQIAAMVYAEINKGSWAITSDFTYMKLDEDIAGKNNIISGDASMKQLSWELAGLYKIKPWLEGGIAMQLNSIESELNLTIRTPVSVEERSRDLKETWIDPSIVARVKLPLSANQKWLFQSRGNIGGFGIGSDFYCQLQAYVGYSFSKTFLLSAGYRIIGVDYEKGSGNDRFKYDMTTFGPVLRFGFRF